MTGAAAQRQRASKQVRASKRSHEREEGHAKGATGRG